MDDLTLKRYADLLVGFGANVQPGQVVMIAGYTGQEEFFRAAAESAYEHGAKFVDTYYFDPWVKRSRIAHAPADTLDYVPPWYGYRMLQLGELRAARIGFSSTVAPGLMQDLDPARAGRDQMPAVKELHEVISAETTNWSGGPAPVTAWAKLVHPDLDEEAALALLWEQIVHVTRLDEPDPVAAWRERAAQTSDAARRLTERHFDSLHLEGPGTDLTIGLLPSSRWMNALFRTADGIEHMANMPSEEVFTTPDPERTQGVVRATKPLQLVGTIVRDFTVRFEGGRAVEIEGDGAEILAGQTKLDDGASRLGEIALVDREGRIGKLDTVFYDTLLD